MNKPGQAGFEFDPDERAVNPRRVHRISAGVPGRFASLHLVNHLSAWNGIPTHIELMKTLRVLYRSPVVERFLLLSVVTQMVSEGIMAAGRIRAGRSTTFDRRQIFSGVYLLLFLSLHVSAVVLWGRTALGIDTNFYFAAAGRITFPYVLFFILYYFLAVTALFVYVGCGWGRFWLRRGAPAEPIG